MIKSLLSIVSFSSFSSLSLCKNVLSNGVEIPFEALLYSAMNVSIETIWPVSKGNPKYSCVRSRWFRWSSIDKESSVYKVSRIRVFAKRFLRVSISATVRLKFTQRIISSIWFTGTLVLLVSIHFFISSSSFLTPAVMFVEYSTKMYLPVGRSKKVSGVPFIVFCFPLWLPVLEKAE